MGKYRFCLAAALAFGGSGGAWAQETAPPVGPPELRDFSLPGTTPPPRQEPEPAPTPPPAEAETPAPTPAPTVTPAPPPREAPRATTPRPAPPRAQPAPAPIVVEPEPAAEAAPKAAPELAPAPLPAPTEAPVEQPAASSAPEAPEGGSSWLWIIVAALAGLAGFALWKTGLLASMTRRTGQPAADPDELMLTQVAPAARPASRRPAAEPAAVRSPTPPVRDNAQTPRPRIDIVFKPARAEATEAGTSVHYELIVKNLGTAPARDVRIEARMFNAGPEQDKEIGGFFAAPLKEKLVTRPFEIPARSQAKLSRVVSMSKEQVRVITIQGRRLFIPMVAFNIVYDRGEGETGQTSKCFVVGREKDTPSEKMGAFRLDLGPRIYRSVGQRQTSLAHIA